MKLNEVLTPQQQLQYQEVDAPKAARAVDPNAPVVPKPKAKRYIGDMDTHIQGIPCQIKVTHQANVKGSYSYNAASDWDYHGYTELEYDVLDRRGYPAPWLERKMTDKDRERIEQEWWESQSGDDDYDEDSYRGRGRYYDDY